MICLWQACVLFFLSKTLEITIYFAITFFTLTDLFCLIILEKVDFEEIPVSQFF